MTRKLTKLAVMVAAATGFSGAAYALDAQSIRVSDGVMFTPTLKVSERYDDNIYATKKDRKSSWVTNLEPSFALSLDQAKSAYRLKYIASRDFFHSSSRDNNTDHHLTADAGFEFNSRNRLLLNAGYHKMEETASEDRTKGSQNDKWNTKNIGGVYTFGARTARTQVDLAANYEELRYDNSARKANGERLNKDRERDTKLVRATGYYGIAPKTKALLEGRYTDFDYKSNTNRDSKNKALLAGVTWDATAKTTGTVKVGREKKSYDKSFYSDKSMTMWEAGVAWAPRTYSTFDFKLRRGFDEGDSYNEYDTGDYVSSSVKTTAYHAGWNHQWMDRLSSKVTYTYTDRKYQNDSRVSSDRHDKIKQYGLGMTYEMRRWLDVGLGYTRRDNDSNRANRDYKRNIYALTFNASL